MATTTTHYGFTKPGVNDYVDISVLNANFDNLDNVIYNNQLSAQAALDDLAPEYDATATYSVDDYVTYNKTLYRCITAIATAEAFDDTKWTAVKVGGELKSHDTRISTLEAGVELEGEATNSFDDGIDSYFKKVVSTIVPVQAGSGTPSPTNVRPITGFTECTALNRGINQWDEEWETGGINEADGSETTDTDFVRSGFNLLTDAISIFGYSSDNRQVVIYLYDANKDYIGFRVITNTTYTTPSNTAYFRIRINNRTSDIAKGIVSINRPPQAGYYAYKATTATIQFGSAGTVYGGYVDLVSGKLVVDKVCLEPTSIYTINTSGGKYYWIIERNLSPAYAGDLISSHFKSEARVIEGNTYVSNNTYLIAVPTDQSLNTKALADEWLQANNPQFVYKLATPQEYQLTPAQLRSLVGTNNLTSSTGEVTEVEYIKNKTIAWLLDLIRA